MAFQADKKNTQAGKTHLDVPSLSQIKDLHNYLYSQVSQPKIRSQLLSCKNSSLGCDVLGSETEDALEV